MKNERGQSTIEYALLAIFMTIAIYYGIQAVKVGVQTAFLAHESTVCDLRPVSRCVNQ